jgi:hypothetical protein
MITKLKPIQREFLKWVLIYYRVGLPHTAVHKVRRVISNKQYGDLDVELLNEIRKLYIKEWQKRTITYDIET